MTRLKHLSLLQSRRLAAGLCLAWALLLLLLLRPTPTQADGTVSDCTQAGLVAAMGSGGPIRPGARDVTNVELA